jgi:D-3-phosphoglycerate dehydrogenase
VYDAAGEAVGFDRGNPLSRSGGKAEAVHGLGLQGEIIAVGDGWTDYEMRAAGAADRFYAFTENVERPSVVERADRVARSFDDLRRQEGLLP